jgi:hypothetical protein
MACWTVGPVKKKLWSSTRIGSPLGAPPAAAVGQQAELFLLLDAAAFAKRYAVACLTDTLPELTCFLRFTGPVRVIATARCPCR